MDLREQFVRIFTKVQKTSSCHQKYVQVLTEIFNRTELEKFVREFMDIMTSLFVEPMSSAPNPLLDKALSFAALFVATIAAEQEQELPEEESDEETHPLLAAIIMETLKFHNLRRDELRFNSCKFLTTLMNKFGSCLDADLCDEIEKAMLERIWDAKTPIRLQAITVLTRLQDPSRLDCPVMQALLKCFFDSISAVRKAAVENIAYNSTSLERLVASTGDIDHTVRLAAMKRISKVEIKLLRMTQRQHILLRGFSETNKSVLQIFYGVLIPNWLAACEQNYIKLFGCVILDAFESDIKQSARICENLMAYFLKRHDMVQLVESITVNENHLVPLEKLNFETILYWSGLIEYFRKNEDMDIYLEQVLSELSAFCSYIEEFLKIHNQKEMKKYERMQFEFIFIKLLDIAKNYDLGDEAGRRNLHSLMSSLLLKNDFSDKIVKKIVEVFSETIDETEQLIKELCTIMSETNEPVEESAPEVDVREVEFETARLNVRLNILKEKLEEALQEKKYEEAVEVQKDIGAVEEEIKNLAEKLTVKKVTKVKNSVGSICHILSILYSLLSLPRVKKICDSLRFCKDEYVIPQLSNFNPKVMLQVIKCIGSFGLLDKSVAKEYVKLLFTHLITFRLRKEVSIEIVLVGIITDFIRLYGMDILKSDDSSSETTVPNRRLRRLCQIEHLEDISTLDFATLEIDDVLTLLLQLCDEEDVELRHIAGTAVMKLMADGRYVTPTMMSRILLKWLNPLTKKEDPTMVQFLGIGIEEYTNKIKGSTDVMANAVIPTLKAIANAPHSSPLLDINFDRMINFLCAVTSVEGNSDSHKSLMHNLCSDISLNPHGTFVYLFTKMLLRLDLPGDLLSKNELLTRAERLVDVIQNKMISRNIKKFVEKLQKSINEDKQEANNNNAEESAPQTNNGERTITNDNRNVPNNNPLPVIIENQELSASPIEFSCTPSNESGPNEPNGNEKEKNKTPTDSPIEFSSSPPIEGNQQSVENHSVEVVAVSSEVANADSDQNEDCAPAPKKICVIKPVVVKVTDCLKGKRKLNLRRSVLNKNMDSSQEVVSSSTDSSQKKKKLNNNADGSEEVDSSSTGSPQKKKKKKNQSGGTSPSSSGGAGDAATRRLRRKTLPSPNSVGSQQSRMSQGTRKSSRLSSLELSDSQESLVSSISSNGQRGSKKAKLSLSKSTSTSSKKESSNSESPNKEEKKKNLKKKHRKKMSLQNCSCTVDHIMDSASSDTSLSSSIIPSSQSPLPSGSQRRNKVKATRRSTRLRRSAKRSSSGRLSDVEKVTTKKKKK